MLHNEELYNLYSLPNIIRQIKSRIMRWAVLVERVGEKSVKSIDGKPRRKETGRKTEAEVGGWDQNGS
jgi:hypothetical protein